MVSGPGGGEAVGGLGWLELAALCRCPFLISATETEPGSPGCWLGWWEGLLPSATIKPHLPLRTAMNRCVAVYFGIRLLSPGWELHPSDHFASNRSGLLAREKQPGELYVLSAPWRTHDPGWGVYCRAQQ